VKWFNVSLRGECLSVRWFLPLSDAKPKPKPKIEA
jgi:hypothetical protein